MVLVALVLVGCAIDWVMRWAMWIALGVGCSGCGSALDVVGDEQGEVCEVVPTVLPKDAFVDRRGLTLTYEVMAADFGGASASGLRDARFEDVHVELNEDMVVVRTEPEGQLVGAFQVTHQVSTCADEHMDRPTPCELDLPCESPSPCCVPWYEWSHFEAVWTHNILGDYPEMSEASRQGESRAWMTEVVDPFAAPEEVDFEAGRIEAVHDIAVQWNELSDGRPGCVLDLPGLPAGQPCPTGRLRVRMTLSGFTQ